MSKIIALIAIVFGTMAASGAAADEMLDVCIDATDGNTPAVIDCVTAATGRADAQLNQNYKQLVNRLLELDSDIHQKEQLKKAQRAWLVYRDANCSFYADPEGGAEARLNGGICLMNTTAQRAMELLTLINKY